MSDISENVFKLINRVTIFRIRYVMADSPDKPLMGNNRLFLVH